MDRYLGKVSCSVRFWYGVEWEIRTKLSRFHTRCTARVRGLDSQFDYLDCNSSTWFVLEVSSVWEKAWEKGDRTSEPLFHTRCTPQSAVKTVRFAAFIYPSCVAYWAEPSGFQPIRIQDDCSVVRYVGGAFLEARPRVSCIMRNGALWECLLRVSGWSYKVSSP